MVHQVAPFNADMGPRRHRGGMCHPSDAIVACCCGKFVVRPCQHFAYAQVFAATRTEV